jgi:Asp-tRNA(Asn)/Glu-tRNA(Gln) amidotransferase A subunit family amidase
MQLNRRRILKTLGALGIGSAVFHRALAAQAPENGAVTAEMIQQAEWIAGIELSAEQRNDAAKAMQQLRDEFNSMRQVSPDYSIPPALTFHPAGFELPSIVADRSAHPIEQAASVRPMNDNDLALLPVVELSALIRTRQITSEQLTTIYLNRLEKYDPLLHCVVTPTRELAIQQAQQADREIATGHYRGALHGIPWGAKDLITYPGYKTTWGAKPFQDQMLSTKATVAQRLDDAGAVLVAKLTLGALAWGDEWFGGMTRNPWNPAQGSSGSSAGSASATTAGLAGFTLGSETLRSIASPCRRCGTTGLRPTFGRVSRFGCMPLAWSMDKIGPIARCVEDCALIFGAIHGHDGLDPTAVTREFCWPPRTDVRTMRIGFVEKEAEQLKSELDRLRNMGVTLRPIQLPDKYPANAMAVILNVEAATVFDGLVRQGITDGLNRWPGAFHQGELTPAVEYLRANRLRTLLIREMEELFAQVDAYIGGDDLVITNLTGHPTVVLPSRMEREGDRDVPQSVTLTGKYFGEESLLAFAHAFEKQSDVRLRHPPLDQFLSELHAQ